MAFPPVGETNRLCPLLCLIYRMDSRRVERAGRAARRSSRAARGAGRLGTGVRPCPGVAPCRPGCRQPALQPPLCGSRRPGGGAGGSRATTHRRPAVHRRWARVRCKRVLQHAHAHGPGSNGHPGWHRRCEELRGRGHRARRHAVAGFEHINFPATGCAPRLLAQPAVGLRLQCGPCLPRCAARRRRHCRWTSTRACPPRRPGRRAARPACRPRSPPRSGQASAAGCQTCQTRPGGRQRQHAQRRRRGLQGRGRRERRHVLV